MEPILPTTNGNDEHYATLGLRNDATAEEVKQAYLDQAKMWHPERFSENDTSLRKKAGEKFKEINVAYGRIQEVQPQHPQQADTAIESMPLREAVLETQVFVTTIAFKISVLQIIMFPGLKKKEEVAAEIQECSAMCKEGVNRLKAVIRRIEHEAPEYPKEELEQSLAQLAEQQAELEEYAASTAPSYDANVWKP